jgi:hypothetical protein
MPRQRKPYTLEQKIKSHMAGANSTNKAQLKRIEKLVITEELEQVPLSEIYVYMNKEWQFKGMNCRLCNTLLTDTRVIDKHRYICTVNKQKMKTNGFD